MKPTLGAPLLWRARPADKLVGGAGQDKMSRLRIARASTPHGGRRGELAHGTVPHRRHTSPEVALPSLGVTHARMVSEGILRHIKKEKRKQKEGGGQNSKKGRRAEVEEIERKTE